ncbi:MAG: DUF362 domain-containing protein [Candidatus Omnitrophica bacterium]|nr:DUF362 domain-containing protein [Candidatus Omnitrophota bacterium]
MGRREFIKRAVFSLAGFGLVGRLKWISRGLAEAEEKTEIVSVTDASEEKAAYRAIEMLGGMGKFVKKGQRVVIKPNIAWNRTVDQAANTHPEVVKALVKLCLQAGAREVIVIDNTCNPWNMTYVTSGIEAAVKEAGGTMKPPVSFKKVNLGSSQVLKEAEILEEVASADVLINVPVVKVHGSQAKVTISMKNLMGVVKDRGFFHRTDLNRCIAEIAAFIKPALTVLDATRILLTRGPQGPGEVKILKTVVAGTDFVALDAFGATLLGVKPETVGHIQIAAEMGLGQNDLTKVRVRKG